MLYVGTLVPRLPQGMAMVSGNPATSAIVGCKLVVGLAGKLAMDAVLDCELIVDVVKSSTRDVVGCELAVDMASGKPAMGVVVGYELVVKTV